MSRKYKKYNQIIIGVDQSYTRTGISIAADGKLLKVSSIAFRGHRSKSDKRKALSGMIRRILSLNASKAHSVRLICERIRTFSYAGKGRDGKGKSFLNINYIKCTGALIATLVDVSAEFGIEVYSVDTRSWKSKIVGTSKGGKEPTLKYVKSIGFDCGKNDDAADSACIALYGFHPKAILKKEE